MLSKLRYLTGLSLKKKMKSKWFFVVNILLLVAIIGIINLDSIISYFGGDFNEAKTIVVIDNTDEQRAYDIFKENIENMVTVLESETKTEVKKSTEQEESEKDKLQESPNILIVFNEDEQNYINAKVISKEKIDTFYYQILVQSLTTTKSEIAMLKSDINKEELAKISSPITIERVLLNEESTTEAEDMSTVMGTVFPTIILPFFMLVIFLVQMIGNEINEEKTTRSMEIIISNVSPKVHFFSKVLASNIFVISQAILLFIYGAIGFIIRSVIGGTGLSLGGVGTTVSELWGSLVNSGFVDKLIYIIPITIVLLLLSFLAYSLVAGILASMTTNMEDYQQVQVPIIFVCLFGYYLAIMAGVFKGSVLIQILSYVPFISCLLSPALLVIGQIGIIDVIISIVILILFNFVAIKYGLRIYKSGILNYSTEKVWKRFAKTIKQKDI